MTVVLDDGETHEVLTTLRDQLRYENAARAEKWGPMGENLVRFEAFVAWSALQRTGVLNGEKFDEFVDRVAQIDSDAVPVRPTTPAAGSEPLSS
jgi:hypothetical protein